ncbi:MULTISPECIES: SRPBCC family protein [Phyllobacteriaceae]|jgi:uncharacterized protein YndB with AHSA1/START domain|uniref:Polyketide cyclase n=1 Tax=Mesorhizobium hungaricum TaxID=1566387 RepID=A0A1C2DFK8_9HYPH|nr:MULTISPECIES: SRPBCC family protein [Mesorhizobium]MBN9232289.1 SRPBCC family protein [Mesorhizobium sp.]MDQ0329885.1 uncharacterized protein YndB with AHSA1/START domain [Mesorhizobium sp. YL-MeA3-2017]OCX13541.1 polyketide cyclase [Mesorhizobium hungaricum]
MSDRSIEHATFTIERIYPATPSKIFHALSDKAAKRRWFADADGGNAGTYEFDFRIGGREVFSGGQPGGPVYTFDAVYRDIVPEERIVYAYDMFMDGKRISVSLATIELAPHGEGTRLVFTEQASFLDGLDKPEYREEGTADLLDLLGKAAGNL